MNQKTARCLSQLKVLTLVTLGMFKRDARNVGYANTNHPK